MLKLKKCLKLLWFTVRLKEVNGSIKGLNRPPRVMLNRPVGHQKGLAEAMENLLRNILWRVKEMWGITGKGIDIEMDLRWRLPHLELGAIRMA